MTEPNFSALDGLRMTRKADRETAARIFSDVAEKYGATVKRWERDRRISLSITAPCGATASICFDGDSRNAVPLISWVASHGVGNCFSGAFTVAAGGDLTRSVAHHKETTLESSLKRTAYAMDRGLECLADGEAFEFYIHPWAANTAWVAAGSPVTPDISKDEWIAHYLATGKRLTESAAIAAGRKAHAEAGGHDNWMEAKAAAEAAFAETEAKGLPPVRLAQ